MKSLIRPWLALLAISALLAAADLAVDPRARALAFAGLAPDEITLASARSHRGALLWIDARSQQEFVRGHLPQALNLDPEHWDADLAELLRAWQPGTRVIVYCREAGCGTSRNVADRLRREYRLPDVWVLHGGWEAWEEAARP